MNDIRIIPHMAFNSLRRNSSAYIPYIIATSLCIAIFYIFASIQQNELMNNLPHAFYIQILMSVGEVLLCIILTPFLFSINSFLIKQRKKELGLYSVLGLEKKHIGFMLFIEAVILFVITTVIGIVVATVFSKLIFLFLLKVTRLPIETEFTFSGVALVITLIFFGVIAAINLFKNLFHVSIANPTELFKASKQGEKEPKHIVLQTILGLLYLGGGYAIALHSKIDSFIFINFFFAVVLVICGTYMLFKTGSISFLKLCRRNKKFYYKSKNFVTISGMLYRMKQNSKGLSNICIFCTMTIITLLCTLAVFIGEEGAVAFQYPNDVNLYFNTDSFTDNDNLENAIDKLSEEYDITVTDLNSITYQKLRIYMDGNIWEPQKSVSSTNNPDFDYMNQHCINAISLADYNRTQGTSETLAENEVLIFTSDKNYGLSTAVIDGKTFTVKKELESISFTEKSIHNMGEDKYFIVFSNPMVYNDFYKDYEIDNNANNNRITLIQFNIDGENIDSFTAALSEEISSYYDFNLAEFKNDWEKESYPLIGGLLFLGIFFGIIFIICMVLIMYYKQISEGYEDKKNFEIMQKVGMTDKEVRRTISNQILMVFFLPLIASILHTAVAMKIVCNLLATLQIFDTAMIFTCAGGTLIFFVLIYGASYLITARSYYKIVK